MKNFQLLHVCEGPARCSLSFKPLLGFLLLLLIDLENILMHEENKSGCYI